METLVQRAVVSFPPGNSTNNTLIAGSQLNRTLLEFWNYTYYDNQTISNDSTCVVTFPPYLPISIRFDNGTWFNQTSCYDPIQSIRTRGALSIAAGVLFALSLALMFYNAAKHRKSHMARDEKRFGPWSRTWTWLLLFVSCVVGAVSGFSGLDVDRDYLPDAALIYQSIFYFFMLPFLYGCVWESARCWSAARERIMMDQDPHRYRRGDRRSKVELYLPLAFLLFDFLSFLFTVPRMWGKVSQQRSVQQQELVGKPAATDGRFQAAGFMAAIAVGIIAYRVYHNHYYYGRHTGEIQWRIILALPFLFISAGYTIAMTFYFPISLMKFDSNPLIVFFLGYVPSLAVVYILNVFGLYEQNSDLMFLQDRRKRRRSADIELRNTLVNQPKTLTQQSTSSAPLSPLRETDSVDTYSVTQPPSYEAATKPEFTVPPSGFDASASLRHSSLSNTTTATSNRRASQTIRSMLDV